MFAIGRTADTGGLNLEALGVKVDKSKKIIVQPDDLTTAANVFSVGDCSAGRP